MDCMDTVPLYQAAARIEELAELVRVRGRRLGLQAAGLHWHSPAAQLFYRRLDDLTVQVADCANRLDRLADRVRAHAFRVMTRRP